MHISRYGMFLFLFFMDIIIFSLIGLMPFLFQGLSTSYSGTTSVFDNIFHTLTFQVDGAQTFAAGWWLLHGLMVVILIADYIRGISS